jgi:hypothetical protein
LLVAPPRRSSTTCCCFRLFSGAPLLDRRGLLEHCLDRLARSRSDRPGLSLPRTDFRLRSARAPPGPSFASQLSKFPVFSTAH